MILRLSVWCVFYAIMKPRLNNYTETWLIECTNRSAAPDVVARVHLAEIHGYQTETNICTTDTPLENENKTGCSPGRNN